MWILLVHPSLKWSDCNITLNTGEYQHKIHEWSFRTVSPTSTSISAPGISLKHSTSISSLYSSQSSYFSSSCSSVSLSFIPFSSISSSDNESSSSWKISLECFVSSSKSDYKHRQQIPLLCRFSWEGCFYVLSLTLPLKVFS